MRYPEGCKNVIDVTKAPYFADNSGQTDCTGILRQVIDDCLAEYINNLESLKIELLELAKNTDGNVYIGVEEGRIVDGEILMTLPKVIPPAKIIFFPKGTYLVSDTVSYTHENLNCQQQIGYICELCRFIHILGEDKENTVIKLADYSPGFEKGKQKPVLCFNRASKRDKETTNCAQQNTLEDISIDCGSGNHGAIGVLFASSNLGRIENVKITGNDSFCGIEFDYGSEGCFFSIDIEGFDYGIITTHTSPMIFDNVDFSKNKKACVCTRNGNLNFINVNWGQIPSFLFEKSGNGRYYVRDKNVTSIGDVKGNYLFVEDENLVAPCANWPKNNRTQDFSNWACVDDYGAVGDGVSDSTFAIQKAFDSGKEVILFGEGSYLISKTIKVPKMVKTIDFMYAKIVPGYSLLIGEMEGMFDIYEESNAFLFAEHFSPDENFSGFFRMFKHTAKRPFVVKDINITAGLYFNTVDDNEVYFDNCATFSSHYTQDMMHRDGYVPVFCKVVLIELHNQKAYGRNLNIERPDVTMLNDHSLCLIDGYKTEGPGKLLKAVNGGKTQFNLFNSAWWGNKIKENCMFDMDHSNAKLTGGNIFCYPEEKEYRMAVNRHTEGADEKLYLDECSIELTGYDALGRHWGRLIKEILV